MRLNNYMDTVRPIPIISPHTGRLCRPKITTRESNGKIITEATWICFDSGKTFRRGVVSIQDKKD